jgi:predicted nucleic acid-binding protein
MPTVADSSIIIHLAAIGKLDLLRQLYNSLLIPPAVWDEVVVQGQGRSGEAELRQAVSDGWIAVTAPPPSLQAPTIGVALHSGEKEAILLAASHAGSLLLMDESAGRSAAKSLGVLVVGVAGILVVAKQAGLIPQLRPILEQLRTTGGFRLSTAVIQHALGLVGE